MGYSTDEMGRLCCDSCSKSGGVKRRKCPHGFCTAWAACDDCWNDPEYRAYWDRHHVEADCKGSAERLAAEREKVAELQAAGEYVFCASVYADSTRSDVKVWFRGAGGDTKETVVSKEVRDTFTRFTVYSDVAAWPEGNGVPEPIGPNHAAGFKCGCGEC